MSPSRKAQRDSGSSQPTPSGRRERRKHPVLRAVFLFGLLMGGYYLLEYWYLMHGTLLESYLSLIATAVAGVLTLLGDETIAQGKVVASRAFQVQIFHGCDALEPTAAYLSALLASPIAFRAKLPGILVGVIGLQVVNLVRIVSLFLVGAHYPDALDIMHYDLWQAAFIVIAIVFWAIWVQWATRKKVAKDDVSD